MRRSDLLGQPLRPPACIRAHARDRGVAVLSPAVGIGFRLAGKALPRGSVVARIRRAHRIVRKGFRQDSDGLFAGVAQRQPRRWRVIGRHAPTLASTTAQDDVHLRRRLR
jgi:hypothetical protein